ncbi:MAG: entericidin A/B family lipoprotein [Candidatus Binatia bacterium]
MGVKTKCKQEIHYALDYLGNAHARPVRHEPGLQNTIHGFGRDVERAGEKTQDAADAVKKKL